MIRSPLIVEIVGPAGAGKSSLSCTLAKSAPAIQQGLRLRKPGLFPLYVGSAFLSLPALLSELQNRSRLSRRRLLRIIYMQAQLSAAKQFTATHDQVLMLDQGPIYALAEICDFDLGNYRTRGLQNWLDDMVNRWATTLNLIIQLDAADDVLLERIGTRDKWHEVKEKPASEARTYLAGYRATIQGILDKLPEGTGPELLNFKTDEKAVESIALQVLAQLEKQLR